MQKPELSSQIDDHNSGPQSTTMFDCLVDIPVQKTITKGNNIFLLQENGIFSVANKKLDIIKHESNKTTLYCNPHKNDIMIIRNKVKDFDWINDALLIWTMSGGVFIARADFEIAYPSLTFHSLSSMGSSLENYNFVSQVSCGDEHSLLLTTSGFWYSFGCGKNGRLGLGDNEDKDEPWMLYSLLDFTVESIYTTAECSFACWRIRNDIPVPITHSINEKEKVTTVVDSEKNIVLSWGKCEGGWLGHDIDQDINIPTPLTLSIDEEISRIQTGKYTAKLFV